MAALPGLPVPALLQPAPCELVMSRFFARIVQDPRVQPFFYTGGPAGPASAVSLSPRFSPTPLEGVGVAASSGVGRLGAESWLKFVGF